MIQNISMLLKFDKNQKCYIFLYYFLYIYLNNSLIKMITTLFFNNN